MNDWHSSIWMSVLGAVAFGLVGIVLTVLGYFLFDLAATRINVQTELAEKQNIAVAIVAAAVIIGVAMVVSAAISG
jgi:putative membrane protein